MDGQKSSTQSRPYPKVDSSHELAHQDEYQYHHEMQHSSSLLVCTEAIVSSSQESPYSRSRDRAADDAGHAWVEVLHNRLSFEACHPLY